MSKKLFLGADSITFLNAKKLRNHTTDAENLLWEQLRNNKLGCKFRRQHPLGLYIADFYCHQYKLAVEVDGSIHNLPEVIINDREKENYLINEGIDTIRFTNTQVLNNVETVVKDITQKIKKNRYINCK